jgi:hypothetical protein
VGVVVRAARGRPGLTENAVVDLAEAAAIRAGVDLAVLTTKRRTIALKDPIFEVTLVQHLVEYLLMYPALDRFDIGWEVPIGRKRIDVVLRTAQKAVLIECKDFQAGAVNRDAAKLRSVGATLRNPAPYVLTFWRSEVPDDVPTRVERHYGNARGLDSSLTRLVASSRFSVYAPEREHAPFAVALFQVL